MRGPVTRFQKLPGHFRRSRYGAKWPPSGLKASFVLLRSVSVAPLKAVHVRLAMGSDVTSKEKSQ